MTRRLIAVGVLLIAGAASIAMLSRSSAVPRTQPLSTFPVHVADWRGQSAGSFDPRVVAALNVNDYIHRLYADPDGYPLSLYVGYYATQRRRATMHSPLNCLPGAGWSIARRDRLTLHPASGPMREARVNRVLVQKGLETQIVLYWYQSHGRVTASEYYGKLFTAADALIRRRTDGALVRVVVPVLDSEATAERQAARFAEAIIPLLVQFFPALSGEESRS